MFTEDAVHPFLPLHFTAVLWIRIRIRMDLGPAGQKILRKIETVKKLNLLKVHNFENFFGSEFELCTTSLCAANFIALLNLLKGKV
jgi:hypothetical protein